MNTATEQAVRRPFHESIVAVINEFQPGDFLTLTELIKATKIPKDHDKIIGALENKFGALVFWERELASVKAVLLEQKSEADAIGGKPASEKKGINLDDLQQRPRSYSPSSKIVSPVSCHGTSPCRNA